MPLSKQMFSENVMTVYLLLEEVQKVIILVLSVKVKLQRQQKQIYVNG